MIQNEGKPYTILGTNDQTKEQTNKQTKEPYHICVMSVYRVLYIQIDLG